MFVYNTSYNERILFSIGLDKLFSYNPNTADFQFIQDIPKTRGFRLHNHLNSLYLTRVENSIYYFNNYKNMFTEISPEDAFSNNFRFGYSELFFKDYFYFLADYYDNGYKLYRIDNTFQTVSNIETQPTDELDLYPNPTRDMLNINVGEPTSVSIIDLTGKVVKSIESYSGGGINTSNLPAGIYNIILDEKTYGGKFVKE